MAKKKRSGSAGTKSKVRSVVRGKPAPKAVVKKAVVKKAVVKQAVVKKAVPKEDVLGIPIPSVPRPQAAEEPPLASPIPSAWLDEASGRELALDSLAAWVVSTLQAAQDDASARETLSVAIKTFYDIREAANQQRGEHAWQFFIVDAVGLGSSNRPVPWQVLAETVSQERLNRFSALFEDVEREVS